MPPDPVSLVGRSTQNRARLEIFDPCVCLTSFLWNPFAKTLKTNVGLSRYDLRQPAFACWPVTPQNIGWHSVRRKLSLLRFPARDNSQPSR